MEAQQLNIFEGSKEPLTWKSVLAGERETPYFRELMSFLDAEMQAGKTIYPTKADIFNAITFTPFEEVKVVIIGQDPYHGPNQAHGLCFSVRAGVPPPPSLLNIFQELGTDVGVPRPTHGCLEKWATQGVLLLNAVLTVEAGRPQSHANRGWEKFTDRIIAEINERKSGVVFLLWGAYAWEKGKKIDTKKHYVLKAPHPSPLSAHRGFIGCRHFSRANEILKQLGKTPIDWSL